MKKFILIICLLFVFCTCENPSECIESTGKIITKNIDISNFNKIFVQRGIELIIKQDDYYEVSVQTGENLMANIEVTKEQNTLIIKDNTTCNWVRTYGNTKVFITTPDLIEIYSKTDKNISSNGLLTFPSLQIKAFDSDGDQIAGAGTGDFFINVDNQNLVIETNNVARFYISGKSNNAAFNIYFGDSRIDCPNLLINEVSIYHRGSNDIITHPISKISGVINSTGNVLLKNNPPIVDVQVLFQGQLIFN